MHFQKLSEMNIVIRLVITLKNREQKKNILFSPVYKTQCVADAGITKKETFRQRRKRPPMRVLISFFFPLRLLVFSKLKTMFAFLDPDPSYLSESRVTLSVFKN